VVLLLHRRRRLFLQEVRRSPLLLRQLLLLHRLLLLFPPTTIGATKKNNPLLRMTIGAHPRNPPLLRTTTGVTKKRRPPRTMIGLSNNNRKKPLLHRRIHGVVRMTPPPRMRTGVSNNRTHLKRNGAEAKSNSKMLEATSGVVVVKPLQAKSRFALCTISMRRMKAISPSLPEMCSPLLMIRTPLAGGKERMAQAMSVPSPQILSSAFE
jgi:hypothetical protein